MLSELDKLKNDHRNQSVQSKAKKIINKIKEYRRRANILTGIPIIKGKITLYSIAVEPNFDRAFTYLNPENNDDRLIASTMEIIRKNAHSTIYLVTGDLNQQNKAAFSSIPFLETPILN